ncbi:hypothetical protein C8Q73DRAFT_820578 [Cubamyces lactineus]|nr:hypothetical protein C8Q73DRAFT_820578 [Cubamyces lactineus]
MDTAAPATSVTIPSANVGASGEAHQSAPGSPREYINVDMLPTRSSEVEGTASLVKKTDPSDDVEEADTNSDEARSTTPDSEDSDMLVPMPNTIGQGAANGDSDDGFIPRGYTTGASASKRKMPTAPAKPSGAPATAQSSKATPTATPVASKAPSVPAKKNTAVPAKRS